MTTNPIFRQRHWERNNQPTNRARRARAVEEREPPQQGNWYQEPIVDVQYIQRDEPTYYFNYNMATEITPYQIRRTRGGGIYSHNLASEIFQTAKPKIPDIPIEAQREIAYERIIELRHQKIMDGLRAAAARKENEYYYLGFYSTINYDIRVSTARHMAERQGVKEKIWNEVKAEIEEWPDEYLVARYEVREKEKKGRPIQNQECLSLLKQEV